jgi:hypothetical protein
MTDETDATKDTEASQVVVDGGDCRFKNVEEAVSFALPSEKHSNHSHLFLLARAVKTMEKQRGTLFSPAKRRKFFDLWYEKAKPYLRKRQTKSDYMIEFLNSYKSAKFPIGAADSRAWDKALENPLPIGFLPHFE